MHWVDVNLRAQLKVILPLRAHNTRAERSLCSRDELRFQKPAAFVFLILHLDESAFHAAEVQLLVFGQEGPTEFRPRDGVVVSLGRRSAELDGERDDEPVDFDFATELWD